MRRKSPAARRPPRGAARPAAEAERLQKVLSAAGIASRRQVEAWVLAGRIQVNGKPADPGQRVHARDVILIDGRRVRLEPKVQAERRVLLYHRPPGEPLTAAAAAEAGVPSSQERLPAVRGHRWLPLSPLAPIDTGLEVYTTDGALRAAAGRLAHELPSVYAVRVRGEFDADFLAALAPAAARAEPPFEILAAVAGGGEARNVWIELTVRRARGRDLRALLASLGVEVSRVMRTQYAGLGMDRSLARGRHRELDDAERDALYATLGLAGPGARPKPVARARRAPAP